MSHSFTPEPLPPIYQRPWFPFVATAALGLLIGMGIGAAAGPAQQKPIPTVTQTVTAPPSPAPTVTQTVEVTPSACLRYIDLSEQGFGYAGESMSYMSDGIKAAGAQDVAGMNAASDKIKAVTGKMNALSPLSNAAKAECKAGAK